MSDDKDIQIQRLGAALDVSNRTIKSMEVKLARMQDLVVRMENDKKSWQQVRNVQEKIIKQQLEFADKEKSLLQDEIIELKSKIKELKSAA